MRRRIVVVRTVMILPLPHGRGRNLVAGLRPPLVTAYRSSPASVVTLGERSADRKSVV